MRALSQNVTIIYFLTSSLYEGISKRQRLLSSRTLNNSERRVFEPKCITTLKNILEERERKKEIIAKMKIYSSKTCRAASKPILTLAVKELHHQH